MIGMEATAVSLDDSYSSGAAATERMLNGDADVATIAELAIVRYAFGDKSIRTLAGIDRFVHMKLIGRRDRGIDDIADLAGKRIGVELNRFSVSHFLPLRGLF